MTELGSNAFSKMKQEYKVVDGAPAAYVACVARAVTGAIDTAGYRDQPETWEVVLFEDEGPNAFALPGGKIGVFTGLLDVAKDQHQLATVIGHEVGHILANHANARLSAAYATEAGLQLAQVALDGATPARQRLFGLLGIGAQVGVLLPYGRAQESEADVLGLELMAHAGFDPSASIELWRNMGQAAGAGPPTFLSTHPSHKDRIAQLRASLPEAERTRQLARERGSKPDCHL